MLSGMMMFLYSCESPQSDLTGQARISTAASDHTSTLSGYAFDAITDVVVTYTGVNTATDGLSEAASFATTYNEISGKVKAECTDLTSNELQGDQAYATSNNGLRTKFQITKQGNLTFSIQIDVEGEEINHGDSITVSVKSNILSKEGFGIQQGAITDSKLIVRPFPNGNDSSFVMGWSNSANRWVVNERKKVESNGNVSHTITQSVAGHKNLSPGDYLLEFTLRISAYAALQNDNTDRFLAKVNKVKATISLK